MYLYLYTTSSHITMSETTVPGLAGDTSLQVADFGFICLAYCHFHNHEQHHVDFLPNYKMSQAVLVTTNVL